MPIVKVTTVGSSAGIVLTKKALARLRAKEGDRLYLTDVPDGAFRLTPCDGEFARQMGLAEQVMDEDRDMLRKLAKR